MTKIDLEFENVSFSYDGINDVFLNLNFKIKKGEFTVLLGHNGAGKSTLVKLALGLIKPKNGNIKIFGKEIKKFNQWDKVGYVQQSREEVENDFPASVLDIILMGRLKTKKGLIKNYDSLDYIAASEALKKVKMSGFENKKFDELSGGQKQRIFLAQQLVSDVELLILDEPTNSLDFHSQNSFYNLLKELNQKNLITIFLITHDIGQVFSYCSRLMVLNKSIILDKMVSSMNKENILETMERI